MLRRLLIGALKGLCTGAVLGAAFQIGLGWAAAGGLLGYLIAMGVAATAGGIAGRPPWQQEAWLEGLLKTAAGLGIGALLYWVASTFLSFELPFALAGAAADTAWVDQPLLFAPPIGALYGAVVELDNTGTDRNAKAPARRVRHVRVREDASGSVEQAGVRAGKKRQSRA